jgi:predicted nucleic acid-binding protein
VTLVVDASVALKWFVEEDGTQQAVGLLAGSDLLIAPDLIVAEVCNAGWKAVRAGMMLAAQHDHAAARLALAFDELLPLAPLAEHAVTLARTLAHPVYDCFYLVLAEERATRMVTADRRLLSRVVATQWDKHVVNLRSMAVQ